MTLIRVYWRLGTGELPVLCAGSRCGLQDLTDADLELLMVFTSMCETLDVQVGSLLTTQPSPAPCTHVSAWTQHSGIRRRGFRGRMHAPFDVLHPGSSTPSPYFISGHSNVLARFVMGTITNIRGHAHFFSSVCHPGRLHGRSRGRGAGKAAEDVPAAASQDPV